MGSIAALLLHMEVKRLWRGKWLSVFGLHSENTVLFIQYPSHVRLFKKYHMVEETGMLSRYFHND
jgi:hypothetical protein